MPARSCIIFVALVPLGIQGGILAHIAATKQPWCPKLLFVEANEFLI